MAPSYLYRVCWRSNSQRWYAGGCSSCRNGFVQVLAALILQTQIVITTLWNVNSLFANMTPWTQTVLFPNPFLHLAVHPRPHGPPWPYILNCRWRLFYRLQLSPQKGQLGSSYRGVRRSTPQIQPLSPPLHRRLREQVQEGNLGGRPLLYLRPTRPRLQPLPSFKY